MKLTSFRRRPSKRSRTVFDLGLNSVPRDVQLLHGTPAVHQVRKWMEMHGAHGIEHRMSLRIAETRGRLAWPSLHIDQPGAMTDV